MTEKGKGTEQGGEGRDQVTCFSLLCDTRGHIHEWIVPLASSKPVSAQNLFADQSQSKLLQLLYDVHDTAQGSVLEISATAPGQVFASRHGEMILLIVGDRPSAVRGCAQRVAADRPELSEAARMIEEATAPDNASFELWDEISRLNNDLATLHREIAKRNAELEWLNNRKNELLGVAAHDLRNPISAIIALSDFIRTGDPLSEDQESLLDEIRTSSSFMLELIDDVLDLASIESGTVRLDLQTAEVEVLVHQVATILGPAARQKRIELQTEVPAGLPALIVDPGKIVQVLQNLVSNALKYSEPGSSIRMEAAMNDRQIRFRVIDSGVGIPDGELQHLFEPFHKTSARPTDGEKSTGLGLAIVKRLVEAHRGTVAATSQKGSGTTVTVTLPLPPDDDSRKKGRSTRICPGSMSKTPM